MLSWPICQKVLLFIFGTFFMAVFVVDFVMERMTISFGATKAVSAEPWISKYKRYRPEQTERERARGDYNMEERIDLIIKANSDPLPRRIFIGSAARMCERHDSINRSRFRCVPKFKNIESRIRVAPQYKLASCMIQKSMSTVMTAIMCYLFNETSFTLAGREFAKECIPIRFCQGKNEFGSVVASRRKLGMDEEESKKWKYTMITRDPIDRFLSGFIDKCIRSPRGRGYCNGCSRNMTCFILTEYDRVVKQLENDRILKTFEDRHFFPQNWRCNLDNEYDNYKFIRYSSDPAGTLLQDLLPILKERKVPQASLDYINSQLNMDRTVHSTVQSEARAFLEKRLLSSPFLLEYIVRIFYYDFKLFNYPFPEGFR